MHNMRSANPESLQAPAQSGLRPASRGRWAQHVALCALVALLMLAIMRWYSWAWAPASLGAIIYMMYASIDLTARRSRALCESSIFGPRPRARAVAAARGRIGARILATLAIGLMAIALVVAAVVTDSQMLGIGTAMAFGAVVFVGLPVWAAAVGDAMPG